MSCSAYHGLNRLQRMFSLHLHTYISPSMQPTTGSQLFINLYLERAKVENEWELIVRHTNEAGAS